MTPKEKAKELYNKFFRSVPFLSKGCHPMDDYNAAKQCALIAVDEIIKVFNPENWGLEMDSAFESIEYWDKVKKEIEAL
jgi:hypothetical protein